MENSKEIVTYKNLLEIKEGYSLEPMMVLSIFGICTNPWNKDMEEYTGKKIFVRQQVAQKLARVNQRLKEKFKTEIIVTYGYRHPEIQERYFEEQLKNDFFRKLQKEKELSQEELYSIAHNFIAVPSVAGHPTGGAVDITLYKNDVELDMGTEIADFSDPKKISTYSELITQEQLQNRLLLRSSMLDEGFVPFNGEWWHFSFGDKEWAYWNGKKKSIYQQLILPLGALN